MPTEGFVVFSSGLSISSTDPSPMPAVLIVRVTSTAPGWWVEPGLLNVSLRHRPAATREQAPQPRLDLRVDARLFGHHLGDGLARQVVLRRPEAARADDEVVALPRPADDVDQAPQVVAHRVLEVEVDAQRRQPRRHVGAVRVPELAQRDLRADGDDL